MNRMVSGEAVNQMPVIAAFTLIYAGSEVGVSAMAVAANFFLILQFSM